MPCQGFLPTRPSSPQKGNSYSCTVSQEVKYLIQSEDACKLLQTLSEVFLMNLCTYLSIGRGAFTDYCFPFPFQQYDIQTTKGFNFGMLEHKVPKPSFLFGHISTFSVKLPSSTC